MVATPRNSNLKFVALPPFIYNCRTRGNRLLTSSLPTAHSHGSGSSVSLKEGKWITLNNLNYVACTP